VIHLATAALVNGGVGLVGARRAEAPVGNWCATCRPSSSSRPSISGNLTDVLEPWTKPSICSRRRSRRRARNGSRSFARAMAIRRISRRPGWLGYDDATVRESLARAALPPDGWRCFKTKVGLDVGGATCAGVRDHARGDRRTSR